NNLTQFLRNVLSRFVEKPPGCCSDHDLARPVFPAVPAWACGNPTRHITVSCSRLDRLAPALYLRSAISHRACMDRMTGITAFVKVVDVGGFAAAARKLDMSPSMVTTHVRALEERLGVRLLNRSTRRISLTEVGQAYYERCLQILADVEDAENVA